MALTISGFTITGNLTSVHIPPPPPGYNLWSWGKNSGSILGAGGQLGLGNTTNYSSPVQVGSLNNWSKIAQGGVSSAAIKTDGTLWSWGLNYQGVLGLGNLTNYSSPKQVGILTGWLNISTGYAHTVSVKTDGTMWSWGVNGPGRLGLGDTTARSSPVQIGALTTWSNVFAGSYHSIAIKTDGTMWSWGQGFYGNLGYAPGPPYNISSPTQVGSLTNWLKVAAEYHTLAIKTNGTLWSWGYNPNGQLGQGNTNNVNSPVQVGALTNWLNIAATYDSSLATKTDGTLWTWGKNNDGQLGLSQSGYYVNRSSPVQVGADTNWANVAGGSNGYHSLALKTDGTLWVWGRNSSGQLGVGDTIGRSSPVQVGSLTTWSIITGGSLNSMAIGYY